MLVAMARFTLASAASLHEVQISQLATGALAMLTKNPKLLLDLLHRLSPVSGLASRSSYSNFSASLGSSSGLWRGLGWGSTKKATHSGAMATPTRRAAITTGTAASWTSVATP